MFTLREVIDLAIRIEKNGEETYRKAMNESLDTAAASLLKWLADEELEHEKWFVQLKEKVKVDFEDPRLEEMGKAILSDVLGGQAFSIKEADFSRIEDLKSLLELSIEFEKDTIIFYEMLSVFISDECTLKGLHVIIEEEKKHVSMLEEFLEKGRISAFIKNK